MKRIVNPFQLFPYTMNISDELKVTAFRSSYHKALLNVIFTGSHLSSHFDETLKKYNTTDIHYNILRILRGQYPKPCGLSFILSRMVRRAHHIPKELFASMTKQGWISALKVRQQGIRDEYLITKEGLAFLEKIDPVAKESEAMAMKHLTPAEAESLSKLLDKLRG